MEVLRARLLDRMIAEQEAARARDRRGRGPRGPVAKFGLQLAEPHQIIINLSVHDLADVINSRLDELVDALKCRQEKFDE